MTVETIHLDDLDDLVADGTLKDETTVLGLFMAAPRLARHRTPAVTRGRCRATPRSSCPGSRWSGVGRRAR